MSANVQTHRGISREVYESTLLGYRRTYGFHLHEDGRLDVEAPHTNRHVIDEYWQLQVPLEKIESLARYRNFRGDSLFFGKFLIDLLKQGYTCDDLLRLAELKDHDGNQILTHWVDVSVFSDLNAPIDDAVTLASLRNSNGHTIFRNFRSISCFFKLGHDVAQAAKIIEQVVYDDGSTVFRTPATLGFFSLNGGSVEYAKALLNLRDHAGKQVYFSESSIESLQMMKKTPQEVAAIVDVQDSEGQTIFSNGNMIVTVMRKDGIERLKPFLALSDFEGKTLFRDGGDIVNFAIVNGGMIEEAVTYASVRDSAGRGFYGFEVAMLKHNNVPLDQAEPLFKQGLNASTIVYYSRLGLGVDNIGDLDGNKPRALILRPTADPLQGYPLHGAFSSEHAIEFLRRICETYAVKLRAISTVSEMRHELAQASDLDLAIISGHGTTTTLTFADNRPKYGITFADDERMLSTTTTNIGKAFAALKAGGTCFLDSCSNGYGGANANNLANHFAAEMPDRTIIASANDFSIEDTRVNSIYPLNLMIVGGRTYAQCTYVVRPAL